MFGLKQFELLEDLRPGDRARAVLMTWNGQRYVRSHETIEVIDFVGQHGNAGDRGYAFLSPESGRWEVACGLYEQVMSGIGA
jgi:hypothetical protein